MSYDLRKVPQALQLGRHTLRTIKQNLFWGALFNLGAFFAAASGNLSPIGGAIVHNIGSLFVVANAARLITRPLDS